MSIFQREGGDSPSQSAGTSRHAAPQSGKQTTVVARGSRLHGEISGDTDVLIDGQIEGRLVLGNSVVVGEGGEVLGQIQAKRVKVGGKVRGDIKASERIEVLASGRIEGDVSAPRVAINAGAFFKGQVEMTSDKPEAKAPPAARPPSEAKPPPEVKAHSEPKAAEPAQRELGEKAPETPSSVATKPS